MPPSSNELTPADEEAAAEEEVAKVEDGSAVVWALLDGASEETNEEAATEDLAEEEAASEEAAGEEEGASEVAAAEEDGALEEVGSADEEAADEEDDGESLWEEEELESAPETSWPCSLHEAAKAFLAVSASPSGHWLSKHFSTSSPMEVQIHSKSAKLLHLEFFST